MHGHSRQPGQVSVWSSSQVVLSVVLLLVLVLSAMAQEGGQKISVRVARVGAVNGRAEQLNGVERRMKVPLELFSVRPDAELQSDAYNSPTVLCIPGTLPGAFPRPSSGKLVG